MNGESVKKLAAAVDQMTHQAFFELPMELYRKRLPCIRRQNEMRTEATQVDQRDRQLGQKSLKWRKRRWPDHQGSK
jgi:hypothetical protein